jgi:hypothetical protein
LSYNLWWRVTIKPQLTWLLSQWTITFYKLWPEEFTNWWKRISMSNSTTFDAREIVVHIGLKSTNLVILQNFHLHELKILLVFFVCIGYLLHANAKTGPFSHVGPKCATKFSLKKFNNVAFLELDSNSRPLVKLKDIS